MGSLAFRLYLSVTGDTDLLTEKAGDHTGCQVLTAAGEFWASRATFNTTTGLYDILGVMGPDEYHAVTDNNVYTNIGIRNDLTKMVR